MINLVLLRILNTYHTFYTILSHDCFYYITAFYKFIEHHFWVHNHQNAMGDILQIFDQFLLKLSVMKVYFLATNILGI